MATINVKTQGLDRSDLAQVFKDFRALKVFENMVSDVAVTIPDALDDQATAIAAAQAAANAAQVTANAAQTTANAAQTTANAAQADVDALEVRAQPLALTDAATIVVNAALHNAFSVTLGGDRTLAAPSGLADGQVLYFAIRQDGTGGRTLSFASIYDFGSAGAPVLSTSAGAVDLVFGYFDSTSNKILSVFRKQDGAPAYFSAHNNGGAQSIPNGAFTKLTLGTEVYDVGAKFASSTWTPTARLVQMQGAVCLPSVAGAIVAVAIYKNGVEFKRGAAQQPQGTGPVVAVVSCQDVASGTDTYELWAFQSTGAAQNTAGAANLTYFQGSTLHP